MECKTPGDTITTSDMRPIRLMPMVDDAWFTEGVTSRFVHTRRRVTCTGCGASWYGDETVDMHKPPPGGSER